MHKMGKLFIGLFLLVLFIVSLHSLSQYLPGTTGKLIRNNQANNLEVYSYVYSDLGDIREFIDDAAGKYGKAALKRRQYKAPKCDR